MTETASAPSAHNRKTLILVLAIFFGVMLVAGALRFSGWRPDGMKNKGELLQPYGDLRSYTPVLKDGAPYAWKDEPRMWRIVVLPEQCDGVGQARCVELLKSLDKVWRLLGKESERVHILWGGAPIAELQGLPEVREVVVDEKLRSGLARWDADRARGEPVWLIDPHGFVVLRYAPGFDPANLRTDLARLLRVN